MVYHWQEAMTSSPIPVTLGGLGHQLTASLHPSLLLTQAAATGAKWKPSMGLNEHVVTSTGCLFPAGVCILSEWSWGLRGGGNNILGHF